MVRKQSWVESGCRNPHYPAHPVKATRTRRKNKCTAQNPCSPNPASCLCLRLQAGLGVMAGGGAGKINLKFTVRKREPTLSTGQFRKISDQNKTRKSLGVRQDLTRQLWNDIS